ncbi:FhaA domain-containing protein [Actinopolymorpha singaporensis]|uniref:FhaA domain-containing protein n=1 Tax=Actinopolymorpha singaporensis TaxID=117157 RepID=UPI003BB0D5D1
MTGTFARVFRSAVQPVEIASALQRELDNSAQVLSRESSLVPNDFVVELSPSDHERLAPYEQTLSKELAEVVSRHAGNQSYAFTGPVTVSFERQDGLSTGRFRVRSSAVAQVTPGRRQPPPDHRQGPGGPPRGPGRRPGPGQGNAPGYAPSGNGSSGSPGGPGGPGQRRAPAPAPYLEVNGQRHPLEPPGAVLGRGTEADLRITDPGVSRRHAEIRVVQEGPRYTVTIHDLGSTNGIVVNGQRVDYAPLREGSQILLGNTLLVLRHPDGAQR